MNNLEAKLILDEHLSRYRRHPMKELLKLMHDGEHIEATAPSGKRYQIEIEAFWDDQPNGTLRVVGSIDDGGWRAFFPLMDDFVIGPDVRIADAKEGQSPN